MMSKKELVLLLMIVCSCAALVRAENLLRNASFEDPELLIYDTRYYGVPTEWRLMTGATGLNGPYRYWLTTGDRRVLDGKALLAVPSLAAQSETVGQDVELIEPDTVYTFTTNVVPNVRLNTYDYQGMISLQTYEGDRYVVLAKSVDYVDPSVTYNLWNVVTVTWDSTDYPQTWGRPLVAVMTTWTSCRGLYDKATLTKAPTTKKIRVTKQLPKAMTIVSENGTTSSFEIGLLEAPTSNVEVVVDPNSSQVDAGSGGGSPYPVVFTPSNWDTAQTVTLSAIDDTVLQAMFMDTVNFTVNSLDTAFSSSDPNNAIDPLEVKVVSNDGQEWQGLYNGSFELPSVAINQCPYGRPFDGWLSLPVDNGLYQYRPDPLGAALQPTDGLVRAQVYSDIMQPIGEVIEANTGYVFSIDVYGSISSNPDNAIRIACYDTPDTLDPNNIVILASTVLSDVVLSNNQWYRASCAWNSITAPEYVGKKLAVIVGSSGSLIRLDNGLVNKNYIALDETDGTSIVNERASVGNTDTYSFVLTRQPTADVTISVTPPDDASSIDLGAGVGAPITLTFNSVNWQTPQTITITAIDDAVNEGALPKTYTIGHAVSSTDPYFDGAYIANVKVKVQDDDYAAVLLVDSDSVEVNETGETSDSYGVYLQIAPTADVTVSLTASADVTINAAQLVFTPENWATPQMVTVTAVDDKLTQGDPHTATINHTISSADPAYATVSSVSVTVTVIENDFCGEWGFLPGDVNQDCYINLEDLRIMAASWLECTNPGDVECMMP